MRYAAPSMLTREQLATAGEQPQQMKRFLFHAALVGLAVSGASSAAGQERAPGVQRLAFVVEVDCARARAVGWGLPDGEDELLVATAAALVRRRFGAMERAARVEVVPGERRIEIGLPSIDGRDRELLEGLLRSIGVFELMFVADETSTRGLDLDLAAETQKLANWRAAHPDGPIAPFNALEPGEHGPHHRLLWAAVVIPDTGIDIPPSPLLLPAETADLFGPASFENWHVEPGLFGYPSIRFDVRASRQDDFARLTAAHQHHRLASLLGEAVVSAPALETELRTNGLIEGRFTDEVAARWLEALKRLEGPLRIVETR